jgi:hypothetical protein
MLVELQVGEAVAEEETIPLVLLKMLGEQEQ